MNPKRQPFMDNSARITQWALASLAAIDFEIAGAMEVVQQTPWSRVTRILTTSGYIYLKTTTNGLALEPVIMHMLDSQQHAPVPQVIALNKNLNCFLMRDCGQPLRKVLSQNFKPQILVQALTKYTHLQSAAVMQVRAFLRLGLPDWRLKQLPNIYNQLLQREAFLRNDGLTATEIKALHRASHKFSILCTQLSEFEIPETLDHCDFHDNNILINSTAGVLTIIDWGETVITQPFFSVLTYLNNLQRYYQVKEEDDVYIALREVCLHSWLEIAPKAKLLEAFKFAQKLWPVYAALGFYRLTMNSRIEEFASDPRNYGRITRHLRNFLSTVTL